jgi:uncharacterized glyoxalase superfamily protein PhnB
VYYVEAANAIDWLCRAFGFEVRLRIEGKDGSIEHSELTFGEGVITVGQAGLSHKSSSRRAPSQLEGYNTQNLFIYVDDVEAHCERARAAGAKILRGPETHDHGPQFWADRTYECEDLEGHHWWFAQRMRSKA